MGKIIGVLGVMGLVLSLNAPAAVADERADWGVAVSVGASSGQYGLLLKNDAGYQLVVVDPYAPIHGAGLGAMTFSDVQPGDRIDYAVVTWSGMDIAEMLQVTPMRHAEARQ